MVLPASRIVWTPSYRLIPSRFPTVGLFDTVADPDDLDIVFAFESETNDRIRNELGLLTLVPPEERVSGPGATLIMAAFTHLNPDGSRFSDGTFGVYYAGESFDTALAEVSYHRTRFFRMTNEPAIDIDMRLILADVDAGLHDVRSAGREANDVCSPSSYVASQALALGLRAQGSWGLVYPSVRHEGGECVALFRPTALANARPSRNIALCWDAERISHWYEKTEPHRLV